MAQQQQLPRYYKSSEVAEIFGVTTPTVVNWIKSGKLKASKINNMWRVHEENLQKFIDSKYGSQQGDD